LDDHVKVIGAGFGRNGTLSTKHALEHLGFGPCHHMVELLVEGRTIDAFHAAGRGERPDWKAALAGYESCVDWPACNFHAQIAEDFPDAKVLLNVRDPEGWYRSVETTIYLIWKACENGDGPIQGRNFEVIRDIVWGERGTFRDRFEDKDWVLSMYEEWTASVLAAYPADRVLRFEVKQGWEPLCDFLGVPVPDEPFPNVNDKAQFAELQKRFLKNT
jgi:hypothetical protein